MLHEKRVWCVAQVESAEQLSKMLTETTWCCCNAFRIADYIWLNDSSSSDGAQEYAVLKSQADHSFVQIESITFGWMNCDEALASIEQTLSGEFDHHEWSKPVRPTLQTPKEHGHCQHCA